MTKDEIIKLCKDEHIRFLRLQFTDIMGINKNVEVPISQLERALAGSTCFDGSSIEGFARIEESDMVLKPDLDTFAILPWNEGNLGKEARVICNIEKSEGQPFMGCPRSVLQKVIKEAAGMGFELMVGPEIEFFLFHRDSQGNITTSTHDRGGYFDLTPIDRGELCRRLIVEWLEQMGFEIEASHHEVAIAQHEIDFHYLSALHAADRICTFKFIVRKAALEYNLHATFMPKPIFGQCGSGMHVNQSLFNKSGENIFFDPNGQCGLSNIARHYMGGLLAHAPAITAITNPLINSYKRLVPGYEAPTTIAWAQRNRSPLIRIPEAHGKSTRIELRSPDPSCNSYLALAVILAAGLDGIRRELDPGMPITENVFELPAEEQKRFKNLPGSISEALDALESDTVIMDALGDHCAQNFIRAKRAAWQEYIAQVHQWEIDRYLATY